MCILILSTFFNQTGKRTVLKIKKAYGNFLHPIRIPVFRITPNLSARSVIFYLSKKCLIFLKPRTIWRNSLVGKISRTVLGIYL